LKNLGAMVKLNPHALITKRRAILRSQAPKKRAKRTTKLVKVNRTKFYKNIHAPAIAPARAAEEGTPTF